MTPIYIAVPESAVPVNIVFSTPRRHQGQIIDSTGQTSFYRREMTHKVTILS